ncbi:MAG: hypothetical protein PF517_00525 [Salinivirgaceae bacterium]|jgi:hypothetical protein|nr:hypothetical protein [Salinivirgaceae bacterium]
MCFSPEASFTGGVIISAIGVATIKKVHNPSQIVFASIPLFFGVQQIAEGFLWITLPYPELAVIQKVSTYFFLTMAQVLWPIIIPFSVLFMEIDKKRKRVLWGLLGIGLILTLYYVYCLFNFSVSPKIDGYHIVYSNQFPESLAKIAFSLYLIATITPFFVSSIKKTHLMGLLMFFSCLITAIFFTQYLISVWCFFAALLSGVVFWILRDAKEEFKLFKLNAIVNSVKLK